MKKHQLFVVLMALVCLFAGNALADEIQLGPGYGPEGWQADYTAHSGDVICGNDIEGFHTIYLTGSGNVELTLKEVTIPRGCMLLKTDSDVTSVTLKLKGENQIPMIATDFPLTITGSGSLNCKWDDREGAGLLVKGDLTIENGSIVAEGLNAGIITEQGNVYINGGSLTAARNNTDSGFGAVMWLVSLGGPTQLHGDYNKMIKLGDGDWIMKAGDDAASAQSVSSYNGEAWLHIEKLPSVTPPPQTVTPPPQTGDSSKPVLWLITSMLSVLGMIMLRRKARV